MNRVYRRKAYLVSLGLTLLVCTPPPYPGQEDLPSILKTLNTEKDTANVTAYGTVRVAVNGEVHTGSIETVSKKTGDFRSTVYSPLGAEIASVRADLAGGTVVFSGHERTFAFSQTMDSLPFSWGGAFSFGELLRILRGRLPSAYSEWLRTRPDTLVREKRTISVVWKTDSIVMRAVIRRASACIDKMEIAGNAENRTWRLTFGSFRKGFAHKIGIHESDVNYFSIDYIKVKSN